MEVLPPVPSLQGQTTVFMWLIFGMLFNLVVYLEMHLTLKLFTIEGGWALIVEITERGEYDLTHTETLEITSNVNKIKIMCEIGNYSMECH